MIPDVGSFVMMEVGSTEYTKIVANNPIMVVQLTKTQLSNDDLEDKGQCSSLSKQYCTNKKI